MPLHGEAGRAKAEREFGLDRLVAETLAAYRAAGWPSPSLSVMPFRAIESLTIILELVETIMSALLLYAVSL